MRREEFGKTSSNEEVFKYWLENEEIKIGILNYGGIITDILVKDKDGLEENIVLSYKTVKEYEEKSPYFGCITGRTAGRIGQGKFIIDEKEYHLHINNGPNCNHGGLKALDKRIWEVTEADNSLELTYFSPHLEEGYPGNVEFRVIYTLTNNELTISYEGIPDRKTLINLTNHSYFNLSGNGKEDILSHELFINSDRVATLDETSLPTGNTFIVEETPFNFKTSKEIGRDIEKDFEQLILGNGYDHPFILNRGKKIGVILEDKKSKRKLEIETDREAVVVYTGNYLSAEENGQLACGEDIKKRQGVCFEAQELPNNINIENFKSSLYSKENPYRAYTKFRFITGEDLWLI